MSQIALGEFNEGRGEPRCAACRIQLDHTEAARTWLHGEVKVVDTTHLTPAQAALQIADAVNS
jgi:hypothetical protein